MQLTNEEISVICFGILFLLSEGLSLIPERILKANSIVQLLVTIIQKAAEFARKSKAKTETNVTSET